MCIFDNDNYLSLFAKKVITIISCIIILHTNDLFAGKTDGLALIISYFGEWKSKSCLNIDIKDRWTNKNILNKFEDSRYYSVQGAFGYIINNETLALIELSFRKSDESVKLHKIYPFFSSVAMRFDFCKPLPNCNGLLQLYVSSSIGGAYVDYKSTEINRGASKKIRFKDRDYDNFVVDDQSVLRPYLSAGFGIIIVPMGYSKGASLVIGYKLSWIPTFGDTSTTVRFFENSYDGSLKQNAKISHDTNRIFHGISAGIKLTLG